MEARRIEGGRAEGAIGGEDREVIIEDGSPRVQGSGPKVVIEDTELREDLRGVKRTLEAQERVEESFKKEMRNNITNLKEGM